MYKTNVTNQKFKISFFKKRELFFDINYDVKFIKTLIIKKLFY